MHLAQSLKFFTLSAMAMASVTWAKQSVSLVKVFTVGSGRDQVCVARDENSAYGPQGIFWKSQNEMYLLDTCNNRLIEIFTGKRISFSGIQFASDLFISEHYIMLLGNISQKISILNKSGETLSCILNISTEPVQTSLLVSDEKIIELNKNFSAERFNLPSQRTLDCSAQLGTPVKGATYSFIYKNKIGSVIVENKNGTYTVKVKKDRKGSEEVQVFYGAKKRREFHFLGFDQQDRFYIVRYEFDDQHPMKVFIDRWSSSGNKLESILLNPHGVFGALVLETTRTFTLAEDGSIYVLLPTVKNVKVLKVAF